MEAEKSHNLLSKSKGLGAKGVDGISPDVSAGEDCCFSSDSLAEREFFLSLLFLFYSGP